MDRNGATLLVTAAVVLVMGIIGAALVSGGGGGGSGAAGQPVDVPATSAADNPLPSYVAKPPSAASIPRGNYPGLVAPPAYQAVPNGTISLRPAPGGAAVVAGVGPAYDPGYRDSIEGHVLRECPRPSDATAPAFRSCYDEKARQNQPTPTPGLP